MMFSIRVRAHVVLLIVRDQYPIGQIYLPNELKTGVGYLCLVFTRLLSYSLVRMSV
jgi:hypothetical protein